MNGNFEHIESNACSGFSIVESDDVQGLVQLARANNVKFIFRKGAKDKNSPPEEFFFHIGNVLYKIKAQGYLRLDDFCSAVEKKFPSAQEFYDAQGKGFDSYEEFKHSKGVDAGSKFIFDEAKEAGFVKGFDSFLKKYNYYKVRKFTAEIPPDINSALTLFEFAKSKGFKQYNEFESCYDAGYPNADLFADAKAKGFKTAEEYFDASAKGFTVPAEYAFAKEKLIHSQKEYDDYRYLKAGQAHHLSFDEFHLLELLKETENGKKLSLKQIRDLLAADQEKYKRGFSGSSQKILPNWYVQKIGTEDQLHGFFCNNADVKKIGTYSPNEKMFEVFRQANTKVYIDGSNVAHNTSGNRIPYYKNIRLMVEELKDTWNFSDIVVIADASLKHKAKDSDELNRIKKTAQYHESPSHTSADKFLLDYIHREKCIVISNDTFTDWKEKDFWVRKNIDRLRIAFMIKEDAVSLYGIERFSKVK